MKCLGENLEKFYFESFLISGFVLVEMGGIRILFSSVLNCTWVLARS